VTVFQILPKAAAAILALPGVESLERDPDGGWCCHLAFGWTTEALGGGGTIIDTNLKTIRAYVIGAYELPPVAAPADVARLGFSTFNPETEGLIESPADCRPPAPELTALPLIRRIQAAAAAPLLPGEPAAPAAPAPAGPAPELPELPSRFAASGFAGLQPWGVMPGYSVQSQQQQQPQQAPAAALPVLPI
jgi:hypothetical protein